MSRPGYRQLEITVPAEDNYLAQLRWLARIFAEDCGSPRDRADDIGLAVNEACANVIIHAYGDDRGPLRLRAWQETDAVVYEISDNGTPVAKPAPGRAGGRGIPIIQAIADDLKIEGPGQYGTRLEIRFNL